MLDFHNFDLKIKFSDLMKLKQLTFSSNFLLQTAAWNIL